MNLQYNHFESRNLSIPVHSKVKSYIETPLELNQIHFTGNKNMDYYSNDKDTFRILKQDLQK